MVEWLSIFGWCHGTRSIAEAGLDGLALASVAFWMTVSRVPHLSRPLRGRFCQHQSPKQTGTICLLIDSGLTIVRCLAAEREHQIAAQQKNEN